MIQASGGREHQAFIHSLSVMAALSVRRSRPSSEGGEKFRRSYPPVSTVLARPRDGHFEVTRDHFRRRSYRSTSIDIRRLLRRNLYMFPAR